ncbi:hypothetical protein PRK78_001620 [Emydomyces testavorans]|uniref:Spindle pole body component n=1 Tax=Emydomyces testavorans TaxID=2070801 RepID=A0AAF0DDA6_9EURO|nr:hypothetical protein PRK78_001620 [Emydomyces testavorans]
MAAALRISALTDELIAIIANIQDQSSPRFNNLKILARKSLKQSLAGRVDKFEVTRRLDGLQEKFQVVGNDRLADALQLRLAELDTRKCHWAPEALCLLLELSDRPATNSIPDKLELFKPPDPPSVLTWSNLGVSDLDQQDIWKDIDYADGSSDDNLSLASSDISIPRIIPQSFKVPLDEHIPQEDIYLTVEDEDLVSSIQNGQAWRCTPKATGPVEDCTGVLTELQIIRETIFMLHGLPNSLFWHVDDSIEVDRRFSLCHASTEALKSVLRSFADLGVRIRTLRMFGKRPQQIPVLQMFQRELESLVSDFDVFLSNTQAQAHWPCVSILKLFDDVRKQSKLLVELASLIVRLEECTEQSSFLCLDLLYELVCAKQAAVEDADFRTVAKLFFKCFESYARPIQLWMRSGTLNESLGSIFVKQSDASTDLKSLWNEWFVLEEVSGKVYGPKFLHPAAGKIFTTGKSMIFLRHLGITPESLNFAKAPAIGYEDIFPTDNPSPLVPFSGLLERAFEQLVNVNHTIASSALRTELDKTCGLWLSMEALDYIYLGKDIALLMVVDQRIFDLIDKGRQSWNDRFLLTENLQQAFGHLLCLDASRLIARSIKVPPREFERHCRSVKILKALSVDYVLPWPVANIISKQAMFTYQRVSTFLMQIRRAKYVLEKQSFSKSRCFRLETYTREDVLSFSIRHHLLWFLNILYYHLTEVVISSSSAKMRKAMSQARDVDGMISVHGSFTTSLEEQCLLSKSLEPIYQAVISILDLCLQFSDVQAARYAEYQYDHANQSATFLHLPSSQYRRRHRLASEEDDDELSSDEDEREGPINDSILGDGNSTCVSFAESSYKERLLKVKMKSDQLCGFVRAGLRGIGRVGGQNSWEMLADRLEWKRDAFV